jgi:hypothetical protein
MPRHRSSLVFPEKFFARGKELLLDCGDVELQLDVVAD